MAESNGGLEMQRVKKINLSLNPPGIPSEKNLILYCRPQFHSQFQFMQGIFNDGGVGIIVGSPGSGKSTTALSFSSTINTSEWVVTWIRLHRSEMPIVCQIINSKKYESQISYTSIESLLFDSAYLHKKQVIFLDEFVESWPNHSKAQELCRFFRSANKENHRLFVITSMVSRAKAKPHEDEVLDVKEHFVESWTLNQYLEAISHNSLFRNVRQNLVDEGDENLNPQQLVEKKFYYAGGCSRFMFGRSSFEVREFIRLMVTSSSNIEILLKGLAGDSSHGAVNSLTCNYLEVESVYHDIVRKTSIVSGFALKFLVSKCGPEMMNELLNALRGTINPSMKGWLYENWFFTFLQKDDVPFSIGNNREIWKSSVVHVVDPYDLPYLRNKLTGISWFRPIKWNQGGYDGFYYVAETRELVVLQLFIGDSHDLKLKYFSDLAKNVAHSFGQIDSLRILFTVPDTVQRSIGTITYDPLIANFHWKDDEFWREANVAENVEFCVVEWSQL